jgi:hypothetical protein
VAFLGWAAAFLTGVEIVFYAGKSLIPLSSPFFFFLITPLFLSFSMHFTRYIGKASQSALRQQKANAALLAKAGMKPLAVKGSVHLPGIHQC